jgi:hypothetical protein
MEDTLQSSQTSAVSPVEDAAKKPYVRPELIRYGDLTTLTQSQSGTVFIDFEGRFS